MLNTIQTSTVGVHKMRLLHRHSLLHCYLDIRRFSTLKNLDFRCLKIMRDGRTDGPTDIQTDGRTRPLIEIRSRI